MSDFKFNGQELDVDLIASIAKLLDTNGIPNVMWGPYVLTRYGAPLVLQLIDRAREVLLGANFVACQDECHLVGQFCGLPRAPAPDDPSYMLVTDDRLDEYDPRMGLGREPYTHYPVKIPTLPRYAESLAYGYLRERNPEDNGSNLRAGFFY
ncbi:uncharacterized protein NFIA_057860 [Aspergillus fischeri NRRL 181]|uniref:Uncharacterized protein n=1 Tax=Neosartorya fischeri (strain ATCC 1020 / DSM 3700 / CBS 544.65 / FGSC A1164 / JCM 1740 / NRRL 181 / WB 181) TaxID=331117 RepID=A1DNR5_NEOFI|nr:uncharacterized protein NFIA_057860 [Aspergillus fischeri NRRL 181]EAW16436.1 hypothetical protein NFIA_057860 [Aspergillus fischeri NRRL 181]